MIRTSVATHGTSQRSMTKHPVFRDTDPQSTNMPGIDTRFPLTTITNSGKVRTDPGSARHQNVYTNKGRRHHLYRRQNDLVTSGKTTEGRCLFSPTKTAPAVEVPDNNEKQRSILHHYPEPSITTTTTTFR